MIAYMYAPIQVPNNTPGAPKKLGQKCEEGVSLIQCKQPLTKDDAYCNFDVCKALHETE